MSGTRSPWIRICRPSLSVSRYSAPFMGRVTAPASGPPPPCVSTLIASADRLGRVAPVRRQPGGAVGVAARVVGVEVDEAALDEEVAHLEDVAPAPGVRHARAPLAVVVLAVARPLARERVAAAHDPVEVRVVVADRFEAPADRAEHLADLVPAVRHPPLREVDLG